MHKTNTAPSSHRKRERERERETDQVLSFHQIEIGRTGTNIGTRITKLQSDASKKWEEDLFTQTYIYICVQTHMYIIYIYIYLHMQQIVV